MILLQTGEPVKWVNESDMVRVQLPASLLKAKTVYPALAFSFVP